MYIALPDAVLHAIQELNTAGFEAYAVGGCVRDSLLGKRPLDWDITTSATPAQMQTVFAHYRTIETGIKHGTLMVLIEDTPLEITTYRIDGTYSDGRHPDKVTFTTSLENDLRRRDFTINAMAYHPHCGVVDFFGGRDDLEHHVIRCVGNPTERFSEDALRIVRALRFAAVLGFDIEDETNKALSQLSPTLGKVSIERIRAEFQKLLCGDHAEAVCGKYLRILTAFLPELRRYTDFSLLGKTKSVLRTRLSALFFSANMTADEAETTLRRLRFDNKTIQETTRILTPMPKGDYTEDPHLLRLLNQLGEELIFDYLAIHQIDHATIQRVHQLLSDNACHRLDKLEIRGVDVIAAGVAPGPMVGEILNHLLLAVIDGYCPNNKEALLAYIPETKKPAQ